MKGSTRIIRILVPIGFFFWGLPMAVLTVTSHFCYLAHRCSYDGYAFIMTPYDGVWFVSLCGFLLVLAAIEIKAISREGKTVRRVSLPPRENETD